MTALFRKAYDFVTAPFNRTAHAELDIEKLRALLFGKSSFLFGDNAEDNFQDAWKYCSSLSDNALREAALILDQIIDEKKEKVDRDIRGPGMLPKDVMRRNLQFCFRFLPFMVLFATADLENYKSEGVLLQYIYDALANRESTAVAGQVLSQMHREVSVTVKLAVSEALSRILNPKNDYWLNHLRRKRENNLKDFQIYMFHLMIKKSWELGTRVKDPLRAFFTTDSNTVSISFKYTTEEISDIVLMLLSTKDDFAYLFESLERKTIFALCVDIVKAWLRGKPSGKETTIMSQNEMQAMQFFRNLTPIFEKVIWDSCDNLTDIELREFAASLMTSSITASNMRHAVPAIIDFCSIVALKDVRRGLAKKNGFVEECFSIVVNEMFASLSALRHAKEILEQMEKFDDKSAVVNLLFAKVAKKVTDLPKSRHDELSFDLIRRIPKRYYPTAEDVRLIQQTISALLKTFSTKTAKNYSYRNYFSGFAEVFDVYFVSTINPSGKMKDNAAILSQPLIDLFNALSLELLDDHTSLMKFTYSVFQELSLVKNQDKISEDVVGESAGQFKVFFSQQNQNRLIRKFNLFSTNYLSFFETANLNISNLKSESVLYQKFAEAFGSLIFQSVWRMNSTPYLLAHEISRMMSAHSTRNSETLMPLTSAVILEGLNTVLTAWRGDQLNPPSNITDLIDTLQDGFLQFTVQVRENIGKGNFKKSELERTTSNTRNTIDLTGIVSILNAFSPDNEKVTKATLKQTLHDILQKMKDEELRNLKLFDVLDFLNNCRLFGASDDVSLGSYLEYVKVLRGTPHRNDLKLDEMIRENDDFVAKLQFDEYLMTILQTFAKQSNLFAKYFKLQLGRSQSNDASRDIRGHIQIATREAISNLRSLVLDNNACINDFQLSEDFLRQFQREGRNRESELKLIADFFQSKGDAMVLLTNDDVHDRLTCAFRLSRYMAIFGELMRALAHLNLKDLADFILHCPAYEAAAGGQGNFRIVDSPLLLENLTTALARLSLTELHLICRIGSSNCALLLEFFRKKGAQFGPDLDRAKQMAARNAHALGILFKLESVHILLLPFWQTTNPPFGSLDQLKNYFRAQNIDDSTTFLVDIDEVVQYFPDIQDYFFEESDGKSADIVRTATKNLKGQYISNLMSSVTGASFSLLIKSDQFDREVDQRKLEEQIQWARLGSSNRGNSLEDQILQCFVDSYDLAREVHNHRLTLEGLGHPDYQGDADKELNSKPKNANTLEAQVEQARMIVNRIRFRLNNLKQELSEWEAAAEQVFRICPRIRFLKFRSRVQFLRTLKQCSATNVEVDLKMELLLPFVVQCFPELIESRTDVATALQTLCQSADLFDQSKNSTSVLRSAERLLLRMKEALDVELPVPGSERPVRLVADNLYLLYLRLAINHNDSSSFLVWGDIQTSQVDIKDAIAIGSSGLCSCLYFFCVDKLSPTVREELLRGLQSSTMNCQVFLLFSSDNGVDAFQQYELLDQPGQTTTNQLRSLLWNPERIQCHVVGGAVGMGKSTLIKERCASGTPYEVIWVHEGFSVSQVIMKYKRARRISSSLFFHINISEYGEKIEKVARFLHNLLLSGLLVDEENGSSHAILPDTQIQIYLEMPVTKVDGDITWPPETFHSKDHPFLDRLPILKAMLTLDSYISVDATELFILDANARFVSRIMTRYWQYNESVQPAHFNAMASELLGGAATPNGATLTDEASRAALDRLFQHCQLGTSKKVRSNFVKTIAERLRYWLKIVKSITDDSRNGVMSPFIHRLPPGSAWKLIQLFIEESKILAQDHDHFPSNVPFTVRPEEWAGGFEAVLFTSDQSPASQFNYLKDLFMGTTVIDINSSVDSSACSLLAPAFGITAGGEFNRVLERHSQVMTPESTSQLLHLNSKRELGSSTIYVGETGCGKTKNLELLSVLLNSSSKYYFNIRLHVVACLQSFITVQQPLNTLPKDWVATINSELNVFIPLVDFLSKISTSLLLLNEDQLLEFCVLVYLYFQLLFRNSLYQETSFLTKYHDNVRSYLKGHQPILERLLTMLVGASKQPIITAEVCTIGNERAAIQTVIAAQNELATMGAADEQFLRFAENDFMKGFIQDIFAATPRKLFYRKLADESLNPANLRQFIAMIRKQSTDIQQICPGAIIVVFIDELNTAGCLGMISELFLSHSIDGEVLNKNIFFVGAINPFRQGTAQEKAKTANFIKLKRNAEDENADYLAFAPYIVKPLCPPMEKLLMKFENLTPVGEVRFLRDYFKLQISIPCPDQIHANTWNLALQDFNEVAINTIAAAQEAVRSYKLPRVYMSIRNLIRSVEVFRALIDGRFFLPTVRTFNGSCVDHEHIFLPKRANMDHLNPLKYHRQILENALVMTIAVGYLFQLPSEGHVRNNPNLIDYRSQLLSALPRINAENFHRILKHSLNHLFGYAKIPRGLAKTNALMENFYAVTLSAMLRIPLLITGPPGCGKTLAYMLVCDCLQGEANISVAFQHLKKLQKKTFQCSAWTTAGGIASFLEDCSNIQKVLRDSLVLAGFDEAGLVPENRQVLKTMHDILDQRMFGIVMMSNTTLDAAKTSRAIHLLQTQATNEDLDALAWGILVDNDETFSDMHPKWKQVVSGFCRAYYTLDDILKDHWFHSRDFVFGCRMLHCFIGKSTQSETLFTAEQLLAMLRRHFQPLDPSVFPDVARHFLHLCEFPVPSNDDLSANILQSLRDSFQDQPVDPYDPTGAHCRYILIVDPTDSEASVDILKGLQLFESTVHSQSNEGAASVYQSISDFPHDQEPRRQADVLGEISGAVEKGKTLLLSNSGPIQSSLYDLINRYYQILTTNGSKSAYTNIALGSFSRQVKVSKEFRLVIIVKQSEIYGTPLPFLNRFERYTVSIQDVLQQRLTEIVNAPHRAMLEKFRTRQDIRKYFEACGNEVESFYQFLGRENAFYGTSDRETVSALLLQYLEDANSTGNLFPSRNLTVWKPSKFVRKGPKPAEMERDQSLLSDEGAEEEALYGTEEKKDEEKEDVVGLDRDHCDGQQETELVEEDLEIHWNSEDRPYTRLRDVIRVLNFKLLSLAKVQTVFRNREKLHSVYLQEYLEHQNHFDVVSLLQSYLTPKAPYPPEKLVVYTRTDAKLIQLSGTEEQKDVQDILFNGDSKMKVAIIHSLESAGQLMEVNDFGLILFQLSSFITGSDCERALRLCMDSAEAATTGLVAPILIIANMKQTTANQITFVRHLVDHYLDLLRSSGSNLPTVLFLLHVSADQLILRSCYQTLPLNRWHALYVDAFTDQQSSSTAGIESLSFQEGLMWMQIAFKLTTLEGALAYSFGVKTIIDCFHREMMRDVFPFSVVPAHVGRVPQKVRAYRKQNNITDEELEALGVIKSRSIYCNSNPQDVEFLFDELKKRRYLMVALYESFAKVWNKLLESTVEEACAKLEQGITTRGFISEIKRSYSWLLSDFFRTMIYNDLAKDWGIEAILNLPEGSADLIHVNSSVKLANVVLRCIVGMYSTFSPQIGKKNVEFNKRLPAAKTPLYSAIAKILHFVIIEAKNKLHAINLRKQTKVEQLLLVVRRVLERHADIAEIVKVIESSEDVLETFLADFMSITLGFTSHTREEIQLLYSIASRRLQKDKAAEGSNSGLHKNIFRWFLLASEIQSELVKVSQLVKSMRSPTFDPMQLLQQIESTAEFERGQIQFTLLDFLVNSLGERLQLLTDEREQQMQWLKKVRDLLAHSIFTPTVITMTTGRSGLQILRFVLMYKIVSRHHQMTTIEQFPVPTTTDPVLTTLHILFFASTVFPDGGCFAAVVEDCLTWVSQCPAFLASAHFPVFVRGLLQLPVPVGYDFGGVVDLRFTEIFQDVSFSCRCELLRQYLVSRNDGTNLPDLDELLQGQLQNVGVESATYIPFFLERGTITNFLQQHVFQQQQRTTDNSVPVPTDRPLVTFRNQDCEFLILRTLFLVQLPSSVSLSFQQSCRYYLALLNEYNHRRGDQCFPVVTAMNLAFATIDVLEKLAEKVVNRGGNGDEVLASLSKEEQQTVARTIEFAPCIYGVYFLSRFTDQAIITTLLYNRALLTAVGLQYWLQEASPPTGAAIEEAAVEREAARRNWFARCLLGLRHAGVSIQYYRCLAQIHDVPTVNTLLNYCAESITDNTTQRHQAALCQIITDQDLALIKHLPVVVSMHSWLKEKFDYMFENEEEVRQMLVTAALERLPLCDQVYGRELFRTFLEVWEKLRVAFVHFRVCGNELRTADGGGGVPHAAAAPPPALDLRTIIPELTEETALLSSLVELGSSEHESLTARMIEKVLLLKLDGIWTSSHFEALKDNAECNPGHYFFESNDSKKAKLSYLATLASPSYLLSGPFQQLKRQQSFENFLSAQISWQVTSDPLAEPDLAAIGATTDITTYLQQERDRLAAQAQAEAAEVNRTTGPWGQKFIICPNCRMLFEKVDRCASVICAWSTHGEHRTAGQRNPGCGHGPFNQDGNLVLAPNPPTVPIHPHFYLMRQPATLPDNLRDTPLPTLPAMPMPTVQVNINWKNLCEYLLLTEFQGKLSFQPDADFFAPLQYFTPLAVSNSARISGVAAADNKNDFAEEEEGKTAESQQLPSGAATEQPRKNSVHVRFNQKSSSLGNYNVFSRLFIVADHIQAELQQCAFLQQNVGNAERIMKLSAGNHRSLETFFSNKTDPVLNDISTQFYSFCEFFLRRFYDYSELLEDNQQVLTGLVNELLMSQSDPKIGSRIAVPPTTVAAGADNLKLHFFLQEYENDIHERAATNTTATKVSNDFKLYINKLYFFQIPAIARLLAEQGSLGSNELLGIQRHFSNQAFFRTDERQLDKLRQELLLESSEGDQDSEALNQKIKELKLIGSEIQKYSEDYLRDNPDDITYREMLQNSTHSLGVLFRQSSEDSLICRVLTLNIQLKHYYSLIKFLRRLIGELEYRHLQQVQLQWMQENCPGHQQQQQQPPPPGSSLGFSSQDGTSAATAISHLPPPTIPTNGSSVAPSLAAPAASAPPVLPAVEQYFERIPPEWIKLQLPVMFGGETILTEEETKDPLQQQKEDEDDIRSILSSFAAYGDLSFAEIEEGLADPDEGSRMRTAAAYMKSKAFYLPSVLESDTEDLLEDREQIRRLLRLLRGERSTNSSSDEEGNEDDDEDEGEENDEISVEEPSAVIFGPVDSEQINNQTVPDDRHPGATSVFVSVAVDFFFG